jgi:hypothetical protein
LRPPELWGERTQKLYNLLAKNERESGKKSKSSSIQYVGMALKAQARYLYLNPAVVHFSLKASIAAAIG